MDNIISFIEKYLIEKNEKILIELENALRKKIEEEIMRGFFNKKQTVSENIILLKELLSGLIFYKNEKSQAELEEFLKVNLIYLKAKWKEKRVEE